MPTHVALLRGINVGGKNKVPMAELRGLVTSLGHTEVATYIQSGNVVFSTGRTDAARLASEIERAISETLEAAPRVVVVAREELAGIRDANPFPDEQNPKALHAVFFGADLPATMPPVIEAARATAASKGSPDEVIVLGRTVYLHTPGGVGRSILVEQLGRIGGPMHARSAGTARNWATVERLIAMCG